MIPEVSQTSSSLLLLLLQPLRFFFVYLKESAEYPPPATNGSRLFKLGQEAFSRHLNGQKNASSEKSSADANIISFDIFESGVVFSESFIHDLSRDVFRPKKMFEKIYVSKNALK